MLEMTGVSFAYHDRPPCFQGLDLSLEEGQAMVLEGPSGAGKSTLLRLATGLIPRVHGGRLSGSVRLAGQDVADVPAHRLPAYVGLVPQDPEAGFVARTVRAELTAILENTGAPVAEHPSRIDQVLGELSISHLADRNVATLSGGEAARASLAAALISEPRLLVLDEPDAQLDAEASRALARTLRALKAGGQTMLISAHRPHPFTGLADTVRQIGRPDPLPTVPELPPKPGGAPLLELAEARHRFPNGAGLGPLSLEIEPGELVAVVGPNGSGKSTLLHLASGLLAPQEGTVTLQGQTPKDLGAKALARHLGISFQHPAWHITQDAVADEVALTSRRLGRQPDVAATLEALGLDGLSAAHPWDLSGGQRQRLAVATAAAHGPELLLLDEPTRGLDAPGLLAVADLVAQRVRAGKATVVATHHPWLIELAHRTVALEDGHRTTVRAPTQEAPLS